MTISLRMNARRSSADRKAAARSIQSLKPREAVREKRTARCSEPIVLPTPAEGNTSPGKRKGKTPAPGKGKTVKSDVYEHVHLYLKMGRWGAWYNDPTLTKVKRLYFGTHLTEELAARAQDRVLLMYRPNAIKPVKLTFDEADYAEDKELREKLTKKEFVKLICAESRACYTKVEPTPCLVKFLREEEALGNLPATSKLLECGHVINTNRSREHLANKKGKPLAKYLEDLISRRKGAVAPIPQVTWIGKRARSPITYYDMVAENMTCKAAFRL